MVAASNGSNTLKEHDVLYLNVNKSVCTACFIKKIHVTGVPTTYHHEVTKRQGIHFRMTVECESNTDRSTLFIMFDYWLTPQDAERNGEKRGNLPIQVEIKPIKYAHSRNAPEELKFTFPIAKAVKATLQEMFDYFFTEKKRHRYRVDGEGLGCLFWVKALINDMMGKGWIEDNETVRKDWERMDSFGKNTEIGDNYYIPYGKGRFF